jgi:tRNA threonylcarbamoyladenosine biosynthesis protein TsaE
MSPRRAQRKKKTGRRAAVREPSRKILEAVTRSPEETVELGRRLARELRPPVMVLLEGELGSGKTTLTKGLVAGRGAAREEEVTSPTFTLVHEYGTRSPVYHVDLYRVETAQELHTLGLEDLLARPVVVIVEWGEKLGAALPGRCVRVRLEHLNGDERRIVVERLRG